MNNGFSYKDIIETIEKIMNKSRLNDKIYVSGGIVPWLISKRESGRKHGDIDFIVKKENIQEVRKTLMDLGLYDSRLDSLECRGNNEKKDFGVETYINKIPVGFYPYEILEDGTLIQRSFSTEEVEGKTELKTKIIPNLSENDYVSLTILSNGIPIGISSIEIILASKLIAGRDKDKYDIEEIKRIGYDQNRFNRVAKAMANMYNIR